MSSIQSLATQIQDVQSEAIQLEDEKILAENDGEDLSILELQLEELKIQLEGLRNEYQSELRHFENMDLGKWLDEQVNAASRLRIDVEGLSNAWLEASCYASICQMCQFRWASTVQFFEQARERMYLSPENVDAYERFTQQQQRKEELEQLWIAAESAFAKAVNLLDGQDPPRLYFKSHDRALQDATNWFQNRQAASRQARERAAALENNIDEKQRELFLDALPAQKIW